MCDTPSNVEKSFVDGKVNIVVNGSVLQQSSPFRHAAVLAGALKTKGEYIKSSPTWQLCGGVMKLVKFDFEKNGKFSGNICYPNHYISCARYVNVRISFETEPRREILFYSYL